MLDDHELRARLGANCREFAEREFSLERQTERYLDVYASAAGVGLMRVLHISESDAAGGAGRAAYKLHSGLNELGHVSKMLVGRKVTRDEDIRPLKRNSFWRGLDRVTGGVLDRLSLQYVFYPSSFGVLARPLVSRSRCRAAAQPARELLQFHGASCAFAPAAGRVAAARPVGDDRARRVLARLRALAHRLRSLPVSRGIPPPSAGHDSAALAAEAPRVRTFSAFAGRTLTLDGRSRRTQPAPEPLRDALHPDWDRHRRVLDRRRATRRGVVSDCHPTGASCSSPRRT